MKCTPNGNVIEYDDARDLEIALKIKCICGHRIDEHEHTTDYYSHVEASRCLYCENDKEGMVCSQFKIKHICQECKEANPYELEEIVLCTECNPMNY